MGVPVASPPPPPAYGPGVEHASAHEDRFSRGDTKCGRKFARMRSSFTRSTIPKKNKRPFVVYLSAFLTRECAHAHERVIAIMVFSLGRLVSRLVRLLTFGHAQ